jgi:hypothetical protein
MSLKVMATRRWSLEQNGHFIISGHFFIKPYGYVLAGVFLVALGLLYYLGQAQAEIFNWL